MPRILARALDDIGGGIPGMANILPAWRGETKPLFAFTQRLFANIGNRVSRLRMYIINFSFLKPVHQMNRLANHRQ
jgi:hypothetical protein